MDAASGARRGVGRRRSRCWLLALPPFLSSFLLTLLTQALIYAILAMSLDLLLGYTGLSSLGHAAYLGLGAYSVGILATQLRGGLLDDAGGRGRARALRWPRSSGWWRCAPRACTS